MKVHGGANSVRLQVLVKHLLTLLLHATLFPQDWVWHISGGWWRCAERGQGCAESWHPSH